MANNRLAKSRLTNSKNAWLNSSFGVCDNIDNASSDSDEIEEVYFRPSTTKANPKNSIYCNTAKRRPDLALSLSRDDLVIHKKKVDEVDAWLDKSFNSLGPRSTNGTKGGQPILLLTGPTGAGKTTTVKVLASTRQIHIMEWINPMDEFVDNIGYNNYGQSQASRFEDFLISSTRYNSVIDTDSTKRLILVEDFPNSFLLKPELFHNIIRKYQYMGKSPVVFIATDVSSGQKIVHNLFPPQIIKELNILNISFNPITHTSLMKALGRIIKTENRSDVTLEVQTEICNSCNGDIRNAILALQYLSQAKPLSKIKPNVPKSRKRKAENTKKIKCDTNVNNTTKLDGKDCLTGLLHSVARVLHGKREVSVVRGGATDTDKRGFLKSDPQEIVNQFLSESNHFVALVHENYLSIFSDIHGAAKATEHICDSDILCSDWKDRDLLREIGFSVAIRGVMNTIDNPLLRWNPLQKPKWKEIVLDADEHLKNMHHLYSKASFSKRTLCMDFASFVCSNVQGNTLMVPLPEVVDLAPESPVPHITDDDSD